MKVRLFSVMSLIASLALLLAPVGGVSSTVAEGRPVSVQTLPSAPHHAQVTAALQSAPVMFIENVGQFDDGARFQVRGGGNGTIWLAEDGLWVTVMERPHLLPSPTSPPKLGGTEGGRRGEGAGEWGEGLRGVNLKLSFPGANPHPRLEPFDRLDTRVSYFIGNDPDQWHPDVLVWGGVRYVDLYPGVDLEITSEAGRWAWRMVARDTSPLSLAGRGAGGEGVRLRVDGADALTLDGDRLRLTTAAGDFTLPLLAADWSGPPAAIASHDVLCPFASPIAFPPVPEQVQAANQSTIRPPDHQTTRLQDNPDDLLYSTFLGGSAYDRGYGIAVDASGAAYVTGETSSSDFPTTAGAFDTSHNGSSDAFVVKVNAGGTGLTYATFLGGSGRDEGRDIAVDGGGAAYVTGHTWASDFPTTAGAFDTTFNGGYDTFIARLNPDGTGLDYATFLGGSREDWGSDIAVDGAGSAYVAGVTRSSDFPTTEGAFDTACGTDGKCNSDAYGFTLWDAFVVKVNASGTGLAYATFLGGSGSDGGRDIAVDASGAAYVTGETGSSDFPTTVGAFDTSYNGNSDAFVVKMNTDGTELDYATFLGGSGSSQEGGSGIAVDESGAAYVTGYTHSSDFPTTAGAFDTTYDGISDAFVVKVNAEGTGLAYATFLGGSSDWEGGLAIAVGGAGSAYVTGITGSSDFPTTAEGFDTSYNGSDDVFVVKVNADGTGLTYATFLGGSHWEQGSAIAVDKAGSAYVTGENAPSDFPTTVGAFDTSHNGGYDAFVAKLAVGGGPRPTPSGSLTLLVASSIPSSHPLTAMAQVRNTGTVPQEFTLTVRLWQDSTTLHTQTFTLSLASGAIADRTVDFGLRLTGRYRVEATLSAGGTTLATQSRDVIVADPNTSRIILDYVGGLRTAAHAELDDIAYIPSWALADEIMSLGLDTIEDYAVGKFADLAAPIQDAGSIPRSWSNDAIDQIQDKLGRARLYRHKLAATVRLLVREEYGVTLPDGFDPLNPDLDFITDPILKDRIKNAIASLLEDVFNSLIISPLWVNGPRSGVDVRHVAFEDFVASHAVAEPPGLAVQMQHGRDHILNVVEGDALVSLGPYNVLGHTLQYDLTL